MADITPIASLNGELAMPEKVWMQGPPGAAATVTVGTVTTGEPGTDALVTNSGTENAAVLNFTIPRGETGTAGAGVPDGGTAGQLLGKTESGTSWIDPPQSGVQPDWNQNDETQPDYVKNRPFWREKTKELAIPNITEPIEVTTADTEYGFAMANGNFLVEPDVTNYVVFDGVEYTCEPHYEETLEDVGIGSLDFIDYPFLIGDGLILTPAAGTHTVLQYKDVYTIHTDYAPCLVIRTKQTEDKTPYLAMEDVEKIKVAFKNGVPIMLHVSIGSTGFDTRVHCVTNYSIDSSGFGESSARGIMKQAEFNFFVHDGSLNYYNVSYSGSITEAGNIYPLMYIKNRKYKITVGSGGTLNATEVT